MSEELKQTAEVPTPPTAEEICAWTSRVHTPSDEWSAEQVFGAWCIAGLVVVIAATTFIGPKSSSPRYSTPSLTPATYSGASYVSSEDEAWMNRPSLNGFSDSEKRKIIYAAKQLDARGQQSAARSNLSREDQALMNLPSLRGFDDSEKRTIIDAAKRLDARIQELERTRSGR